MIRLIKYSINSFSLFSIIKWGFIFLWKNVISFPYNLCVCNYSALQCFKNVTEYRYYKRWWQSYVRYCPILSNILSSCPKNKRDDRFGNAILMFNSCLSAKNAILWKFKRFKTNKKSNKESNDCVNMYKETH